MILLQKLLIVFVLSTSLFSSTQIFEPNKDSYEIDSVMKSLAKESSRFFLENNLESLKYEELLKNIYNKQYASFLAEKQGNYDKKFFKDIQTEANLIDYRYCSEKSKGAFIDLVSSRSENYKDKYSKTIKKFNECLDIRKELVSNARAVYYQKIEAYRNEKAKTED